jgi:hypothetical protein
MLEPIDVDRIELSDREAASAKSTAVSPPVDPSPHPLRARDGVLEHHSRRPRDKAQLIDGTTS